MIAWSIGQLQSGHVVVAYAKARLPTIDAQYRDNDIGVTPSRRFRTTAAGRSQVEDAPCAARGLLR